MNKIKSILSSVEEVKYEVVGTAIGVAAGLVAAWFINRAAELPSEVQDND